ncbi:MAG TPA: ABC transporter permease [Candidatus Krumholzibacteria bacterium]|nr:ABC transporter permease [Candidatus Krumholzibacteria bacterium]HRX50334.1 ABC transporter permease [Candidatus Krumholzibacteria bacterium]
MNRPRLHVLHLGAAMLAAAVLAALAADLLSPAAPNALGDAASRLLPLGQGAGGLGTDVLGRDVLSRLLHGARTSLLVGLGSVALTLLLGGAVGLAAGLGPRWLDRLLMGFTDLLLAFPRLLLALLIVMLSEPSRLTVILVIGATGWMGTARLLRAEALGLREREFVLAARGLGLGPVRLALRHILPHVAPLLLTAAALRLGNAILLEAFLSYLGLGAQEPLVSWGAMIEHGRRHLLDAWWLSALPGLAITWTVLAANLLGDGLRDRWDPRAAGKEAP